RFRVPRILDAGPQAFGRRARDDGDAPVHVRQHGVEQVVALGLADPGDLARHAKRREAADAVRDEQIDDALQALGIDVAGRVERGRKDGKDAHFSVRLSAFGLRKYVSVPSIQSWRTGANTSMTSVSSTTSTLCSAHDGICSASPARTRISSPPTRN